MSLSESCSSSSKRKENGDESAESERPLKKARFAWQVKGKYNLKNESNGGLSTDRSKLDTTPVIKPSESTPHCSKDLQNHLGGGSSGQNLDLSDYLLKQDLKTITRRTRSDSEDSSSSEDDSAMSITYSKYLGNKINIINCPNRTKNKNTRKHTKSDVNACIAEWQAKQNAMAYIDNSTNHVLDSWTVPAVSRGRSVAIGFAEFLNNLPDSHSVEDEGIMMAISAHGLHSLGPSTSDQSNDLEETSSDDDDLSTHLIVEMESKYQTIDSEILRSDADSPAGQGQEQVQVVPSPDPPEEIPSDQNRFFIDNGDMIDFTHYCDLMDEAVSFAVENFGLQYCL